MGANFARTLPDGPRKSLAARLPEGEGAHKPLVNDSDDLAKKLLGSVIDAALRGAGITKQEATHAMGYGTNQAPLSNWIAGRENPQLSRLWAIGRRFRSELVIALAHACDCDVEVKTVVTVSQRKVSA